MSAGGVEERRWRGGGEVEERRWVRWRGGGREEVEGWRRRDAAEKVDHTDASDIVNTVCTHWVHAKH